MDAYTLATMKSQTNLRPGGCVQQTLGVTLALAAAAFIPGPVSAQQDGLFILDLPTSPAAASLGDAHPLFGSADNAIFVHPALLATGSGFGVFYGNLGIDTRHLAASASGEWWDGGVGIGVQTVDFQGSGRPTPEGPGIHVGPFDNSSQSVVSVGYAREVFWSVNLGVVGKIVEVRSGTFEDRTGALDIGASKEVGPVGLALSVQGLGPDPDLGTDPDVAVPALSVDPRVTLGAATRRRPVGPFDLAAAAAVMLETDGTVAPGGGLELSWWPVNGRRFIARAGLQRTSDINLEQSFTAGAGFEGDDIALEYAFQDLRDDLGSIHRFGVRWR